MGNWVNWIFWIIVVGAFVCFYLVKRNNNRKAALGGEDKELVRKAAEPLLGEGENTPILYAHWEEQESYGRTVRTTYYRYAVSYLDQMLCITPLHIDKKTHQVQTGELMIFGPEQLGKVTVNTRQKNGAVTRIELWLGDKQGQKLFQLYIDAENLQKSRWYPVNIIQQEECTAFERFINSFAQRVAAENPDVEDLIKANNNESNGILGIIISAIGAFIAFFFPPAGIVLSLIGLILAMVSKLKGAKSKKPLIICMICTIWSIGFLWMYMKYFV